MCKLGKKHLKTVKLHNMKKPHHHLLFTTIFRLYLPAWLYFTKSFCLVHVCAAANFLVYWWSIVFIFKWEHFNPFIVADIFQKMLDHLSFRKPELVPCSSSWSQAETSCDSSSMRSFLHLALQKLNSFSTFLCFSQFGFCVILRGTYSKVSMLCWSCERWPGSHAVLSFCTLLKSNMKFFVLF